MKTLAFLALGTAATIALAQAQDPPAPDHGAHDHGAMTDHAMPARPAASASAPSGAATSPSQTMAAAMPAMNMTSALGPYSMTRQGSGTSWVPEATPMEGLHLMHGGWMGMAHGFVNLVLDDQSGPRGDRLAFTQSMFMLMANRPAGAGTLGLRAMVSLDPTMGPRGYPLLLQTGETADGRTGLVDRQHPHDFFMELSGSYSVPLGDDGAAFVYLGWPGEPALGPAAFMHRWSGMRNPEAPLTHHWLDATHITFGVATLGANRGPWQIEASAFNGREPDQHRWNIESRGFDSWSTRLSFNPDRAWSMQVSHGDLKSPEALHADVRVRRDTASATWHRAWSSARWETTLAWGRNRKSSPAEQRSEPAWLLESTLAYGERHTFFGRYERLDNSELFEDGHPLHDQTFRISKLSLGYVHDFARTGPVRWGLGGVVGFMRVPGELEPIYGRRPRSAMLFLQARL